MANIYDKGNLVRCTGTWTNQAGTPIDPSGTITFKWQTPAGTDASYVYLTNAQLVRSGTGVYYVDLSANLSGQWTYRFESTGSGQAAGEKQFHVRDSQF